MYAAQQLKPNNINMKHQSNYLRFLQCARNLTELTCRQYEQGLNIFSAWIEHNAINESEVTPQDVTRWIMSQTSNGIKSVTVNNRVIIMRRYYDYCCMMHNYNNNPFVAIKPLKVPKLLPRFIPAATINSAVAAIPNNTFDGVRKAAIVMMFFCTGMRRSELLQLSVHDVDLSNRIVHVFGKGRKERICPIPNILEPYLTRWVTWRAANCLTKPQSFFCHENGNPISPSDLAYLIRQVFAGYVDRKLQHPHILRHSFATVMMQAGVPIPDIAQLMGHVNTSTTLRYLSLSPASQYNNILNSIFKQ